MSGDNTNKVVVQFIGEASSLNQTIVNVQQSMQNMSGSVGKSMFKAMVAFELLKKGLKMVADATVGGTQDAMKYEATMDSLGQRLGKSAQQFVDWSNTTGRALGYSKLQSAEMANTLTVTLSQIATSQEDLTNKTTALMEASAVIRAKTGRTMEDVSERIRSAMNQEADGADELGLNVRTNAITMSDAYRRMADGTPWKDLNQHQQKAILYQYILDQTAQNFGTTLSDNTSLRVAQFTASLADLKLSLGQAFLPIVNFALPYLNALIQWLTVAIGYVRVFMETLFGYKHDPSGVKAQTTAMKGFGGAVKDATNAQNKLNDSIAKGAKARKDAKKGSEKKREGLANFDEIHTLPEKGGSSSSSGGAGGGAGAGGIGGGGGIGAGGFPQIPDPTNGLAQKLTEAQQKVADFANSFKAFMQPIIGVCKEIWNAIVTYVVGVFQGLNEWWSKNGDYIGKGFSNLWNNFLYPVLKFLVEMIWENVKGAIDGLVKFFEGLMQFIGGVFSGNWKKAFEGLWMMVKGAFKAIWNIISLMWLADGVGLIKDGLAKIGQFFGELFTIGGKKSLPKMIDSAIQGIIKFFSKGWKDIWADMGAVWGKVSSFFTTKFVTPVKNIFKDLVAGFKQFGYNMWSNFSTPFSKVASFFRDVVVTPIKSAFSKIGSGALASITTGLKSFVNNTIRPALNGALDFADKIPGVNISWRMPHLYNGGITNGKTIAQIGDNVGGQEVVAPLDRLTGIIAQTMRSTLAMNSGGGSNQPMEVVLKVGSTEFGRVVVDSINKLTKQEGRLALNI